MVKRKSFGTVNYTNTELQGVTIALGEDGDYVMGTYAFRPTAHRNQFTTDLHLEIVTAIGEEELVRSVYRVMELRAGKWGPCETPYVAPFCIRADAFVKMQEDLRQRENPKAVIIHAEFFAEYIA